MLIFFLAFYNDIRLLHLGHRDYARPAMYTVIIRMADCSCDRQFYIRNNLGNGAEVVYRRADVGRVIGFERIGDTKLPIKRRRSIEQMIIVFGERLFIENSQQ